MFSNNGFHTVVSQDGDRCSGFFLQYSASDGRWAFTMTNSDTDNAAAVRALSGTAPAVNSWVHLAGVYNAWAGQVALYVNGVLQQGARPGARTAICSSAGANGTAAPWTSSPA